MIHFYLKNRQKISVFLMLMFFLIFAANMKLQNRLPDFLKNSESSVWPVQTSSVSPHQVPENGDQKRIALTFDDGPHPVYTKKLLEGLKARDVKATFFIIGQNASENPGLLSLIHADGHLIGNHTYSHVQLTCVSQEKAMDEINRTNAVIEEQTGQIVRFIRPPYGSLPDCLQQETTLKPVLWTIDPRDWSVLNTDAVVRHILKCAKNGDIILLHDIFETSVDAALIVIDQLKAQGFTFVTVDQLLDVR